MTSRRLSGAIAAGTLFAATLVTGGIADASTPAGTTAVGNSHSPTASQQAHPALKFTCPKGAVCVHLRHSDGSYTWENFWACSKFALNGTATWYVNNQTGGATGVFYYPWEVSMGAPVYKGRPPYYPYDKTPAPTAVRPC